MQESTSPKEDSKADAKIQKLSLKSVGPRGSLTPYNLRPSETLKMKLSAESIKNACKGTPGWTRKSVRRKLNLGQGQIDIDARADKAEGDVEKENVEPETYEEFKSDVLDSSQLHDEDEPYQVQSQEEAFLSAREETFDGVEAGDEVTLQGDEIAVNVGPDLGNDDKEPTNWIHDVANPLIDCSNADQVPTDCNSGDQVPTDCSNGDQAPTDCNNSDQGRSDRKNEDQLSTDCNNSEKIPEIPIPDTPVMNETFIKTDDLPQKTQEVKPENNAQIINDESYQKPPTISSSIHDTKTDLSVEPNKENKKARPKSKLPLNKSVHFSTVSKLSRPSVKPKSGLSSRKSVAVAIPRKSLMPIKSSAPKKSAIPRMSKVADPGNKAAEKNLRRLESHLQPPNLKSYQRHTIASMAKARPSQLFSAPVVAVVPESEKVPETKRRLTVVGNKLTRKSERVPFRLY